LRLWLPRASPGLRKLTPSFRRRVLSIWDLHQNLDFFAPDPSLRTGITAEVVVLHNGERVGRDLDKIAQQLNSGE
jgi:hypothetical protein